MSAPLPHNYGLLAHPLIIWLLDVERDVKAAVIAFMLDQGDARIPVAGPPERGDEQLPVIYLQCRKTFHGPARAIEINCTPDDLALIWRWKQRKLATAH